MPPVIIAAAVAGAASIAGAAIGASKKEDTSSGVKLGRKNALETQGYNDTRKGLSDLQNLYGAGAGQEDVTQAASGQRNLIQAFQEASKNGGLPTMEDIQNAQQNVSPLFEARRVGLQQAFGDQQTRANQQAVAMGRDINDPILRAKLATEQSRQSNMLGAEEQGAAQDLALKLPGQRLNYLSQGNDLQQNLANQAYRNKTALLQAGQSVLQNERDWRFNKGKKWGQGTTIAHGNPVAAGIEGIGAGVGLYGAYQNQQNQGNMFQQQAETSNTQNYFGAPSLGGHSPLNFQGPIPYSGGATGYNSGYNPYTK